MDDNLSTSLCVLTLAGWDPEQKLQVRNQYAWKVANFLKLSLITFISFFEIINKAFN